MTFGNRFAGSRIARILAAAGLLGMASCEDPLSASYTDRADGGVDAEAPSGTFLAFTGSFANFRTWEAFPLVEEFADGNVHLAGKRTEFLNMRPPKGSKTFPIGTIIVKEFVDGPYEKRQAFAMVKRSLTYNATGAVGWEWFELQNDPNGVDVTILWRGVGPPDGERYGGAPTGACNVCHAASKKNDFVASDPLKLERL